MREVRAIEGVDKSQLVDLRDVKIDRRLTKENRIKSYINTSRKLIQNGIMTF